VRVLFIGRGADHASTRIRLLQYQAPLEALGVDVRVLEWEPHTRAQVARLSIEALRLARWADVVVILKPRLHPTVISMLRRVNARIVVDIDDAMWTWGAVFADRFEQGARAARAITAGSGHLATIAADRYPHAEVVRIPSAVVLGDYPRRESQRSNGAVVVGWIGNTASLADFDPPVVNALRRHVDSGLIRVRVVSSEPLAGYDLRAEFEPWSQHTEVDSLRGFDIGIMPLRDDEQSWGRCGLKAIQCMAVGVPVVASPVGAAPEIVDGETNGLLASTTEEWFESIGRLAGSAELRNEMGARGRDTIAGDYSVEVNAPRFARVLASVSGRKTGR
jgi:glycosyltransferase involved in cell wall biosynthesis